MIKHFHQHPEIFQGEYFLQAQKPYFEGWYIKHTNNEQSIAFIFGIHSEQNNQHAFIQLVTSTQSYYIPFSIHDFSYTHDPFSIQIKKNKFSLQNLHLDIFEPDQQLIIKGDITYTHHHHIHTSRYAPNIMGPFSYLSFMECHHALISMKNQVNGGIYLNHELFLFHDGIGYMEKDWGSSFPTSYLWCQGNHFTSTDTSFMLSIADIPFKCLQFQGLICVLIIQGQEYRFATYHATRIIMCTHRDHQTTIILQKGMYRLTIHATYDHGQQIAAPIQGKMNRTIFESINASISLTLQKKKKIIFSDTSPHCGFEIAQS